MTRNHHILLELSIAFILAILIGTSFAFYSNPQKKVKSISLPIIQTVQNILSPTPSPSLFSPRVVSQISPDGKKKVTMTITLNRDFTTSYTVVASNADGANPIHIFTATYGKNTLEIPFTTWSPDDQYVFLTVTQPTGRTAFVLRADGAAIANSSYVLDVGALFTSRITGNIYVETTGWASESLLIINTKTPSGEQGTSYWFEVPSQAIIPLSTKF